MAQYIINAADLSDLSSIEQVSLTITLGTYDGFPVIVANLNGPTFYFKEIPASADVEVMALVTQVSTRVGGHRWQGVAGRIDADNQFYVLGRSAINSRRLSKRVAGTITNGDLVSLTDLVGWGWESIVLSGDVQEGRSWVGDDPEGRPSTAGLTSAYSDLSTGRVGWAGANIAGRATYIREFRIGTDGDPAPTGPVAGTVAPTLSAPGVIDVTDTSARPQVTLTF